MVKMVPGIQSQSTLAPVLPVPTIITVWFAVTPPPISVELDAATIRPLIWLLLVYVMVDTYLLPTAVLKPAAVAFAGKLP